VEDDYRIIQWTMSRKAFRMLVLGLTVLVVILLALVSPQPFWVDQSWRDGSAGAVFMAAFLLLLTYRP
jgi:hypothetical protein